MLNVSTPLLLLLENIPAIDRSFQGLQIGDIKSPLYEP